MGSVGPTQPYRGDSSAEQPSESSLAAQRVREEVEMVALTVFLASVDQNDDPSSKQGQLKEIEKEVKEGLMSPGEAIMAMFALTQHSPVKDSLKLPPLQEVATSAGRLLAHIEFFALFLDQNKATQGIAPLLKDSVELADQLHGERIAPKDAAEALSNCIYRANRILPAYLQYPSNIGPRIL